MMIQDSYFEGIISFKTKKIPNAIKHFTEASNIVDKFDPYFTRHQVFLDLSQVLTGNIDGLNLCHNVIKQKHNDAAVFTLVALTELCLGSQQPKTCSMQAY